MCYRVSLPDSHHVGEDGEMYAEESVLALMLAESQVWIWESVTLLSG
jgi:hypothetical protein